MNQTISLLGGRGFIGSALTDHLTSHGFRVRVLSRAEVPTQRDDIEWQRCDPYDAASLSSALTGSSVAVNLVGILNPRAFRPRDFDFAHVRLANNFVAAARAAEVRRVLHLSALHADANAPSEYLRTKARGENIVHDANDLNVTSFRPSVVFGAGDSFLLRFAQLLKFAPGVFPLACPDSLFAPVFVGDLAERMRDAIAREDTFGERLNICGPERWTLIEIVRYVAQLLDRKVRIVPLTKPLSRLQAQLCEVIPGKPFSVDNYLSLQVDSVCPPDADLCATRLRDIAPSYVR